MRAVYALAREKASSFTRGCPVSTPAALPQIKTHHNEHMALKRKKQERKRFVERARWEYAHVRRRKEKSALIDAVVQFVGYKSRKQAIRALNRKGKSKEGRKSGRRKKLTFRETDVLQDVWFAMGQPCGKRMQPELGEWLERMEKRQGVDIEKLLGISAATLDRELAQFKVRKAVEKEETLHLTSLKKIHPIRQTP